MSKSNQNSTVMTNTIPKCIQIRKDRARKAAFLKKKAGRSFEEQQALKEGKEEVAEFEKNIKPMRRRNFLKGGW